MKQNTCKVPDCSASTYVRELCRPHYRRLMKYGDPLWSPPEAPHNICSVDGCEKLTRSRSSALCKMHYHRAYRHGDLEANYRAVSTATPRLYRRTRAVGHPVADKSGNAYVHRKVLYDTIGGGVHQCHWCSCPVEWHQPKGADNNLVVDHLNGHKDDNRPANLVASCGACNSGRASQEKHKIITEKLGAWSINDTVAALRNEDHRRRPNIEAMALA